MVRLINNNPSGFGLTIKNITWNFFGRIWSAVLSVLSLPFFIKSLGAEEYGLISFIASLEVFFAILDFGLSATINREIAGKTSTTSKNGNNTSNLIRTFEIIYWLIGLVIGIVVFLGGRLFLTNWINLENLSESIVQSIVIIIGISLVVKWPTSLYSGVLRGYQRQDIQNKIIVITSTFRVVTAVLFILFITKNVIYFLLIQFASNGLQVGLLWFYSWKISRSKSNKKPIIQFELLQGVWRFALSFNLVGVIGLVVQQIDKLAISRFLPISEISYYSIAMTASGLIQLIPYSVVTAFYPRFARHYAEKNTNDLSNEYSMSLCMIVYFAGISVVLLALFSTEILQLWTGDLLIIQKASLPLRLISIAYFINAVFNSTYILIVSTGHTKAPLIANISNLIVFSPLMFIFTREYQLTGTSIVLILEMVLAGILYFIFMPKDIWKSVVNKNIHLLVILSVLITLSGISITFVPTSIMNRLIYKILVFSLIIFLLSIILGISTRSVIKSSKLLHLIKREVQKMFEPIAIK